MIFIEWQPDIILLDINMPQMDGLEVCRLIRDKVTSPILFLTARVEEEDRVNGLMSGGDDYILKPFSLRELEARIIAHLKREQRHQNKTEYRFDKERIYENVSGFDAEGDSRVITELIRRVRGKLGKYSGENYIETVWGMGYRWKK